MNYVEYLRAVRALRIAAIGLAVLVLLAVVGRFFAATYVGPDKQMISMEHSKTAKVTRQVLQDGTVRTVIDDPAKHEHAVIDLKNGVYNARMTNAGLRRPEPISVDALFLVGLLGGFVIASILGCSLAKENDGHLEIAWTKPVSRTAYALGAMALDGAAIVVAVVVSTAAALGVADMYVIPQLTLSANGGWAIAAAFIGPIAWYAYFTAATASLKRTGGIIALLWIAAVALPTLAQMSGPPNFSPNFFHTILQALALLDPLTYMSHSGHGGVVIDGAESAKLLGLVILAVVYLGAAVLQWRRVEA